jgi:predicted  nucleic acid-binding Zn-ribbon protein
MKIEATAKEIRALLELAELDESVERLTSEARRQRRDAVARRVPRRLLERYQGLIEAGRVPGVVVIVQGACSGCHLRLPTMLESTARRSRALHGCPHCRRMLYAAPLAREDADGGDGTPSRDATEASTARRS